MESPDPDPLPSTPSAQTSAGDRALLRRQRRLVGAALTVPEVAERLRVGEDTVRGWIATEELKAINVASRGSRRPKWRISPEALAAFEAARAAGAPRPALSPQSRRRPAKPTKTYF
jgi:excisionase family DNA binding protein